MGFKSESYVLRLYRSGHTKYEQGLPGILEEPSSGHRWSFMNITELKKILNDKEHKPDYAVIDASGLDQDSPAVAWLHGRITNTQKEEYTTWWLREIVPIYHDSGIVSLAVGTGDPNAPGELPDIPPGVKFKIGYFPDFESALLWNVG